MRKKESYFAGENCSGICLHILHHIVSGRYLKLRAKREQGTITRWLLK